jgi:phosphate transport system permease protein
MTTYAPTKPWQPTKVDISKNFLGLLIALVVSFAVVQLTPMKGKLAYAGVLFISATVIQVGMKWISRGRMAAIDGLASSIAFTGSVIVFLPVVSILYTTISKGVKGLHWTLFTDSMENSSYLDPIGMGGILHAIVGTMYMIIIASVISVPLSILTALYLTEIKGKAAGFIQFLVQAMSGVPSVVAGIFIYAALLLNTSFRGSGITGALPLAILMIPTVTRTAQEVLLLIPNDLREAGQALGATQWKTVITIVVPAARSGLVTAVILGVARIAGETAPLLFTIGGSDKVNWNPFNGPQSALPYYVWKGLISGTPEAVQRAWTAILVLLMIVLFFFSIARYFSRQRMK